MSASDGTAAVRVRGLRKSFGERLVLDGIDLDVAPGTILGYIGPNGAGKTTTVRILTALLGDFAGEVEVAGCDPRAAPTELKARIGYVPENAVFYEQLTVAEHLLFVGRLHGLADDLVRRRADRMLEVLALTPRLSTRIATLSKGMRQKLLLVTALLHDPWVLFLDEPLSGLDVHATILVKEFLRRFADSGRTVLYCSHVMDVVERVCDRIVILAEGRVAAEGTFEELRARRGGASLERIFADVTGAGRYQEDADRLVRALEET